MAKWLDSRTAPSAEVVSPIDTIIMGGLAERCVADSARKPAGPSVPLAVTMATPIARQPIAFQKVFASISLSMPLLLYCPISISEKSAELRYANVATASRKRLQSPQQRGRRRLGIAYAFPRLAIVGVAPRAPVPGREGAGLRQQGDRPREGRAPFAGVPEAQSQRRHSAPDPRGWPRALRKRHDLRIRRRTLARAAASAGRCLWAGRNAQLEPPRRRAERATDHLQLGARHGAGRPEVDRCRASRAAGWCATAIRWRTSGPCRSSNASTRRSPPTR